MFYLLLPVRSVILGIFLFAADDERNNESIAHIFFLLSLPNVKLVILAKYKLEVFVTCAIIFCDWHKLLLTQRNCIIASACKVINHFK